jgi:hypothetical protein
LREDHKLRVFERSLISIYLGLGGREVTGEGGRLHKFEFYDLYSSTNIIRVIKSRRMKWAEHVARMGEGEAHTRLWSGDMKERNHLENLGVDGSKF